MIEAVVMSNSFLFSPRNSTLVRFKLRSDALGLPFDTKPWTPTLYKCIRSSMIRVGCETRDDAFYIRRCVELARMAVGCTSPNPMVGCIIVKNGEIVGQGFHPKAGQPHAEVFALKDAGNLAENATAYVSLEPCNHYGRTPPCTEALIRAKVKQVVVGMLDPNPIVASKGVERLQNSGIHVIVGVEEMLCRKLNEAYIHRMLTGRPFVTLRYTISFNGSIMNQLGKGAEEPGGYYSQLLQEYDGILIPSDMLIEYSTLPTSHEAGANQLFHIVIAKGLSSLHLPGLTTGSAAKVVVLAENDIKVEPKINGVEIVILDKITLSSILEYCGQNGICSILVDFRVASQCLSELLENDRVDNLVQKVVMEVCPIWGTGTSDGSLLLPSGWNTVGLKNLESRSSNESVVIEGYI